MTPFGFLRLVTARDAPSIGSAERARLRDLAERLKYPLKAEIGKAEITKSRATAEADESALWLELLREDCGIAPADTLPMEKETDLCFSALCTQPLHPGPDRGMLMSWIQKPFRLRGPAWCRLILRC